ncbi:MAG: hypothetical protein HY332_18360 [Chloroflexi bacterium]|nr:hypothetical protein [Chloroflexota bacterium]
MVAVRALASGPKRAAEDVTLGAALFADEARLAAGAFVDGVGEQRARALEGTAQGRQIRVGGLRGRPGERVAQAEGVLPARRGAIAGAGGGQWRRADRTGRRGRW